MNTGRRYGVDLENAEQVRELALTFLIKPGVFMD